MAVTDPKPDFAKPREGSTDPKEDGIDDPATGDRTPPDSVSSIWDLLAREAGSIEAPWDWSVEHDHYLYGTPKRGDEGKKPR